jgi:hypothetical protein
VNIFAFVADHTGYTNYLLGNVSSQAQFCQVFLNFLHAFLKISYDLKRNMLTTALFWIITQ